MSSSDGSTQNEKLDYLGDEWSDLNDIREFTAYFDERKSLFIVLMILAFGAMVVISGICLYLVKPRLLQISHMLYQVIFTGTIILLTVIGLDFIHLFLSATFKRKILFTRNDSLVPRQYLIPAIIFMGKFFGISKDRISNSFLKFNNSLVKTRNYRTDMLRPGQVLVLLPRCIQHFECAQVVTESIDNCKGCGKCAVKSIDEITREFGCHTSIETGGSGARRTIRKLKPDAIIAVACERELLSGIQDVPHIRILGVTNRRPEGPCKNTLVSMDELRECLQEFIHVESRSTD